MVAAVISANSLKEGRAGRTGLGHPGRASLCFDPQRVHLKLPARDGTGASS
jgi:hypothetical protein